MTKNNFPCRTFESVYRHLFSYKKTLICSGNVSVFSPLPKFY